MNAKNGYCSAQLKQAKNLARDGYFAPSIAAVGIGIESLLPDLYADLCDKYKGNLIALNDLSLSHYHATLKKRWSKLQGGQRELNLFGWIEFYGEKEDKIFRELEQAFGYKFDAFNRENLHKIRKIRNKLGVHPDEQYDVQRECSSALIDLYTKILSETGRIAQPRAIVPSTQLQTADPQELPLLPIEKYEMMRYYNEILRIEPDNLDVLFLRAYLSRGETAAQDDLEKILQLNPTHSEAREERKWYSYHPFTTESTSQRPTHIYFLTQINQYITKDNRNLHIIFVFIILCLFGFWLLNDNALFEADYLQLQTKVDKQSTQLEVVENELKEKDVQVEAIKADLQQLQTTVQTQPAQFAESVSDLENNDALTPNLGIEDKTDTQHTGQGESLAGNFEALLPILAKGIFLIFGVYIVLLLAKWIFFEIVLPRLMKWLFSQLSFTRLLKLIIVWPLQYIKELVRGLFRR